MRLLSILRHAKSSWKDVAADDHDRPLTSRGERDVPVIAGRVAGLAPPPDVALCSTARRARDTAVGVLAAADCDAEIRLQRRLYLASPATWRAALAELPAGVEHALVVGHNPGLEELLQELVGQHEDLPTAALARVELEIPDWSALAGGARGTLVGVWRPRELSSGAR